jgi:hypothetical protein
MRFRLAAGVGPACASPSDPADCEPVKRLLLPLGLLALLLPLAARASTWASTTPGATDPGATSAYASNALPEGFLEGEAEVRSLAGLAARAAATLDDSFLGPRSALAHAQYTQEFRVTAAGPAAISWFVQGALRAAAGDVTAVYQVNYSFRLESDAYFGVIAATGDLLSSDDPSGTVWIGEIGSSFYDFAEFQVGGTFRVTASLDAVVSASNFVATGPAPALSIESDFFDTAGISNVTGGIETVPEPMGAGPAAAAIASLAALAGRWRSERRA